MFRNVARNAAFLLLISCVGCASTHSGADPSPHVASYPLTISVKWPARTMSARSARHVDFISPSAQSVTLALGGTLVATMNAPATGGTTTAVTIAYVGNAVLTAKTFDGPNGTGTILGEVNETPVITPGKANTVALAIEGIAASATLAAVPNQPLLQGNASAGYVLLGNDRELFNLTLKDADGNIILSDPPPFTTSGNSSVGVAYAPDSASQVAFFGASLSSGFENITLQLNNPDGTTLDVGPVKIEDDPLVAVLNGGTNSISMFDGTGNAVTLPSGSFSGLVHPIALAYDPCLRLIVVADAGTNALSFFGADGQTYPYQVGPFTGISHPTALVAADTGGGYNYVVTNAGDDSVRFYTALGPTQVAPLYWNHTPSALACTALCGSLLLVSSDDSATILNPQTPLSPGAFAGLANPSAVLPGVAPMSAPIYIANRASNTINTYDLSGKSIATSGSFPGLSSPTAMTNSPTQPAILVANAGNGTVTEYDVQGHSIALPTGAFSNLDAPSAILGMPIAQCYGSI